MTIPCPKRRPVNNARCFLRGAGEWRLQKLRVPRDFCWKGDEFTIEKNHRKTMDKL